MNQINLAAPNGAESQGSEWSVVLAAIGPTFLWVLLILSCLLMFRKPITRFLNEVREVEAFGARLFSQTTGLVSIDGIVNQFRQNDVAVSFNYTLQDRPFNIYFFSHDLMLTFAGLVAGARPESVAFTLRSALNHVQPLGLSGTPVHESLMKVADQLARAKDSLSENDRSELAHKVWIVSRFVGEPLMYDLQTRRR